MTDRLGKTLLVSSPKELLLSRAGRRPAVLPGRALPFAALAIGLTLLLLLPAGGESRKRATQRAFTGTPFQTLRAPLPGSPLAPSFPAVSPSRRFVPDQVIVRFKPGTTAATRSAVNGR